MNNLNSLKILFHQYFDNKDDELFIASAPGENLIGEHTDYCHGYVMPFGLEMRLKIIFRKRSDSKINVVAHDLNKKCSKTYDIYNLKKEDIEERFMSYVLAPVIYLVKEKQTEHSINGFDAVITSTIPTGAGVSSSSALVVASALTFAYCNEWKQPSLSTMSK